MIDLIVLCASTFLLILPLLGPLWGGENRHFFPTSRELTKLKVDIERARIVEDEEQRQSLLYMRDYEAAGSGSFGYGASFLPSSVVSEEYVADNIEVTQRAANDKFFMQVPELREWQKLALPLAG